MPDAARGEIALLAVAALALRPGGDCGLDVERFELRELQCAKLREEMMRDDGFVTLERLRADARFRRLQPAREKFRDGEAVRFNVDTAVSFGDGFRTGRDGFFARIVSAEPTEATLGAVGDGEDESPFSAAFDNAVAHAAFTAFTRRWCCGEFCFGYHLRLLRVVGCARVEWGSGLSFDGEESESIHSETSLAIIL